MMRGSDVPNMMTRVETALQRAAQSPGHPGEPIYVTSEGVGEGDIAHLRHVAGIRTDFLSGSDRVLVGPAIRLAKRGLRRLLRWYVEPMMEQQSRFNHATLDLVEQLRLQDERLITAVKVLDPATANAAATDEAVADPAALADYLDCFGTCTRVVQVGCADVRLLQLLVEKGIDAYGVDAEAGRVERARAAGLEAMLADPVEHLRQLPGGSVDGVFSALVAHLLPTELVALLEAAFAALAASGTVVVETAAPADVSPAAEKRPPIHPEAVRQAMEGTGFVHARMLSPDPPGPPTGEGDEPPLPLAAEIEQLDRRLRRRAPVAVVATRT